MSDESTKGTGKHSKLMSFMKNEIGYWAGLGSAVITLICAPFVTIIPVWAWIIWLVVVGLIIITLVVKLVGFIKKSIATKSELKEFYNKKIIDEIHLCHNQYKECSEEIHKYFHNMRDCLCGISFEGDDNSNYLEQILRNACSDIETIFSKLWKNEKVSVCVKRIVTEKQMDQDFAKWKIETIARSASTKQSRNKNNRNPVLITDNSDFMIIISPDFEDSVFSCMDLTKVKQEFQETYNEVYKNSTKDFLKYYKSTIVVPIRIQVDKMNCKIRDSWVDGINYHLVGFLCIDTEDVFSGCVSLFDTGVELAKALADILYKLIENSLVANTTKKEYSYNE